MAGGLRRRGSVVSLRSIASFALSIGQKEAWKELSRELYSNGITADMIKAKKEEIYRLFRTSSIRSLVLQGPEMNINQDDKQEKIPAKGVRYFAARLLGGKNALHVAAAKGEVNLVKVLSVRGAAIDATAYWTWTTLASEGHIDVATVFDKDISIGDTNHRKWEWTPLHLAALGGHIEVVKVLLDRGARIDATNGEDWTALYWAARDRKSVV